MDREHVFRLISEERSHQVAKWEASGHADRLHTVQHWVDDEHIGFYLARAKKRAALGYPTLAMSDVRKIAALCVAAMECHETLSRSQENTMQSEEPCPKE